MNKRKEITVLYSGSLIAKNTIFNLLGYGIPLIIAILIIPFLIKGLGNEKFGILSLSWVIIGYFSLFDFGIGKALTKIIAEKLGENKYEEIPIYFGTSFLLMLIISIVGTIVLLLLLPAIVYDYLKISQNLQNETLRAFYLLTFSIPIVTTTAGIRGVLEAYQAFRVISIIRIFLGVLTFLVPLICLFFTNNLISIVLALIFVRILVWILYFTQSLKVNNKLLAEFTLNIKLIKKIFRLSGWMTISNIIVPMIVYLDRFLIGTLISASAIAYYTTPYEIITKFLVVPGAITGVLFPTFSANYLSNPDFIAKLMKKAIKYIFLLLFPVILIIIFFANEGMALWLGKDFADESYIILQFLAAGVLFNSIAYIPFTFLEGIGCPDITAKIQLSELPIYIFFMWIAVQNFGINGAAIIWFIRMILDSLLLFFFAKRKLFSKIKVNINMVPIVFILFTSSLLCLFLFDGIITKLIFVFLVLSVFVFVVFKFFLEDDEKVFLRTILQKNKTFQSNN